MKTRKIYKVLPFISWLCWLHVQEERKKPIQKPFRRKVKVKGKPYPPGMTRPDREFTATVKANISNNIAPQSPVRIVKLFAEVGDHVKAGQVLVKMDETNLKQAKIQLDNQELNLNASTNFTKWAVLPNLPGMPRKPN